MAVAVQVRGINDLFRKLDTAGTDANRFIVNSLLEVGEIVRAEAKRRAPKSPSKGQYLHRLNAMRRLRRAQGKKSRKSTSTTKQAFHPGGLENSIDTRLIRSVPAVAIFVGSNTEAGKYGFKMHEDQYKLGPGSKAKQAGANAKIGRKYIERAALDNVNGINRVLDKAVADFVRMFST